jgi:hypothetical protein
VQPPVVVGFALSGWYGSWLAFKVAGKAAFGVHLATLTCDRVLCCLADVGNACADVADSVEGVAVVVDAALQDEVAAEVASACCVFAVAFDPLQQGEFLDRVVEAGEAAGDLGGALPLVVEFGGEFTVTGGRRRRRLRMLRR